jgi:thermostable 8-oxoguanine DNA glycosylase
MTDETKFDPKKELMKGENRDDRDVGGAEIRIQLRSMVIHLPQEMITAVEYIVANAQGLGFQDADEFIRSAIRDKITEIQKAYMTQAK